MNVLMVVNNLRVANGVATVIMNQYDELLKNGYNIDFLEFIYFDSPYVKKIKSKGGNITTVKRNYDGIKKICRLLKSKKYDILHINQMNFHTVILVILAKVLKIEFIVYHSHNTKIPGSFKRRLLEKMCNFVYNSFGNKFIACSTAAGKDSFGKRKFIILKNSINIKKFNYSEKNRKKIRTENKISDDTFVVGTVCRIAGQKNPLFMLDIISEIVKIRPNMVFLWVGSAVSENDEILKKINVQIEKLNIKKNVLFVGSKNDVNSWYSAMDVFLMPSKWEGLGITYIEAQANSLPTFASNVVPNDTKVTDLIKYLSLDDSPKKWAKEICKYNIRDKLNSDYYNDYFIKAGFDSKIAKSDLAKIYNNFYSENDK